MGRRIAVIEKDKCHPKECGNYLCIRVCPVNRTGDECITKGGDGKAHIEAELCTGCGICPKRCPFGAIHIINLPDDLDEDPIHRHQDENGFHLYRIPIPIFGKVTGILGRNGIGKSTAMKVLAGVLKPNLGTNKEATIDEVIHRFKGTEAQLYFEKLRDGKIKVAYKPQAVDLIPKQFQGTVRELLVHVDEKKQLSNVVKRLQLENVLDTDITKISGGELQRVAIAATVLKKANVYFFDEPTSFLDIKQRLRVAEFIRELATPNTAVMVIEHDLIILDHMTDLIHVMYGEEQAYGVVSKPKASKAGINAYLEGYLREENMRFRDHEIKFMAKPPTETRGMTVLTGWKGIKAKLGKFQLVAKEGSLWKNEVVGILGENGIGKTSFVKILAGVSKTDAGDIDTTITVSYKPQYLEADSDEVVMVVLNDAIMSYEHLLIRPLGLKDLFQKQLNQLSGGELQRVAIAACLAKKADLYLLDEPSAFLDVEQRLIVAKVIREVMQQRGTTSLVVDHDILFLDYLSDRLVVFDGEPAKRGEVNGPMSMEQGMNMFLSDIGLTFRRDMESYRPRANKPGSQMDREQKAEGKLYYT